MAGEKSATAVKKPVKCSPQLFSRIIERIAAGDTLSAIARKSWACKRTTFLKYKEQDEGRRDRYTRARVSGVQARVDLLHDIPDLEDDYGKARLKCDNIKWEASKIAHHIYGDKMDITSGGGPLTVNFKSSIPDADD